jgi:uncharacterized protein (TIGR00730 family)
MQHSADRSISGCKPDGSNQVRARGIRTVAVFCGSSLGARASFAEAARATARTCSEHDIAIIFGGSNAGLMGVLAAAAREFACTIVGVTTRSLARIEPPADGLSELVVTDTLSRRKELMLERADAVLVLPGGLGSLDEAFEAITLRQLGSHSKPIVFVSIDGFWKPLNDAVSALMHNGFVRPEVRRNFTVCDDLAGAFDLLLTHRPQVSSPLLEGVEPCH